MPFAQIIKKVIQVQICRRQDPPPPPILVLDRVKLVFLCFFLIILFFSLVDQTKYLFSCDEHPMIRFPLLGSEKFYLLALPFVSLLSDFFFSQWLSFVYSIYHLFNSALKNQRIITMFS